MQNDLKKAVEVLKNGGVILYPTDTFWGIGCDATNPLAVEKVYRIKGQEDPERMEVLLENPALLERYVKDVPEIAWELVEISTTPLTVIYPEAKNLAHSLLPEDNCIAIRFTKEEFSRQLLQRFRKPVVFTTANINGEKVPEFFDEIQDYIISQVDYSVEYRQDDSIPARPGSLIKLWPGGKIDIIRK